MPLIATPTHMVRIVIVLFAATILTAGCSDKETIKNNALHEEITKVHDEAMEKIGYLYELETQLKKLESNLDTKQINRAVKDLQHANRAMFDWMHQYQTLSVDTDMVKDNLYREEQLVLIIEVQRLTYDSIQSAEKLLSTGEVARSKNP